MLCALGVISSDVMSDSGEGPARDRHCTAARISMIPSSSHSWNGGILNALVEACARPNPLPFFVLLPMNALLAAGADGPEFGVEQLAAGQ